MNIHIEQIHDAILNGDQQGVVDGVKHALEDQLTPDEILNQGMISAMQEVGKGFENGDYFVPEMLIAARAMQAGLNDLKPLLANSGIKPLGKVVLCTVKGDLHDIGKNLVGMMLEGAGFEVLDLGVDISPMQIVESVQAGADIVGLSALLTTTMPSMRATIAAIENAGLRDQVKIMIGGAPVTQEFADDIGADGFAADASKAVNLAKSLIR